MDQDYITIYQDQPKSKLSPRTILIIAGVAVALLVVIVIIINIIRALLATPSNFVKITNYSDLPINPPSYIEKDLTAKVSSLLSEHFDISGVRQVDATIRSDTFQDNSDDQVSSISFILDVDAYQQSYEVSAGWSDTALLSDDISLECATKNDSKYPSAKCYGFNYDSDSPYLYLPYEGKLDSGETFTASYGYQDSSGIDHIDVTVSACDDDSAIKASAVDAVKDYLATTAGLDADTFIYQRSINHANCNN